MDFIIDFNEGEDFNKMMQFIGRVRPRHLTMYSLEVNEGSNLHRNVSSPTFKKFIGKDHRYEEISSILTHKYGY